MQKTFEVSGPVEIEIRLESGSIEIEPSLDGAVEIELSASDEESQRLIEAARIELQDRPGRPAVLVDVPKRRGFGFNFGFNRGIECRIRCPHDSGLQVRSKSADLLARGTLGGLSVATASGDVEVETVSGGVSVKSASADFTAREIGDGASIQSASGDVEIGVARGPVNVTTASGDVTVNEAYDNVVATVVSGDLTLGAVLTGKVNAQSVSGDVEVGVRRGSKVYLDCSTVSGDTSSELDVSADAPAGDGPLLELRARTVSGDITIRRAPAPAADTREVHA